MESKNKSSPNAIRSSQVWMGLVAGVACGLFFGELCAPLALAADAFVGLMQMTVLPLISLTLVLNLGRLTLGQARRLSWIALLIQGLLWTASILVVVLLAQSFPSRVTGAFFSSASLAPQPEFNFVEWLVPANIFRALANNEVPAVVLFCIFLGIALILSPQKQVLIESLERWIDVLLRVNRAVSRLTPYGVFAISAHAAGTMSFDELKKMESYLIAFVAGALFLTYVLVPLIVGAVTPFRAREVVALTQNAMVTALATGKLILTLPQLIEQTERLFRLHDDQHPAARNKEHGDETPPSVDVLMPLAYPFPHLGKLMSLLFIPFAAWFLGTPLELKEYPELAVVGVGAHFAGPLIATTYLLEFFRLPHDMLGLFVVTGVVNGRIGDMLGVMHLTAFALIAGSATRGWLTLDLPRILRGAAVVAAVLALFWLGALFGIRQLRSQVETKADVLAQLQLLDSPVDSIVLETSEPNPAPKQPGESTLARVRRRGVLRVGFNDEQLPFAYRNARREVVGYDANLAHILARDLNVSVEFVPVDRERFRDQVKGDHFDVVMSGVYGSLERAEAFTHTDPYLDVNLAMVVPDYRAREFSSFEKLRGFPGVRIGIVEMSEPFARRFYEKLPQSELVRMQRYSDFFESPNPQVDAILISAESGAAYTLLHPHFEMVVPSDVRVSIPLFYIVGDGDIALRDFLNYWIQLRRKDGTLQDQYDHWVLGKSRQKKSPRWSVLRNILDWHPQKPAPPPKQSLQTEQSAQVNPSRP